MAFSATAHLLSALGVLLGGVLSFGLKAEDVLRVRFIFGVRGLSEEEVRRYLDLLRLNTVLHQEFITELQMHPEFNVCKSPLNRWANPPADIPDSRVPENERYLRVGWILQAKLFEYLNDLSHALREYKWESLSTRLPILAAWEQGAGIDGHECLNGLAAHHECLAWMAGQCHSVLFQLARRLRVLESRRNEPYEPRPTRRWLR